MATKRLKRGKPIRVPAAGTVTIQKDGAVVFKPAARKRKTPAKKNPWSLRRKLQDRKGQLRNAVRRAGRTVKAKAYKAVGKRMRRNPVKRRASR